MSEALGLTWDRVDWKTGTLTLVRRKVSDELTLPMAEPLSAALHGWWTAQGTPVVGPVIVRTNGKPPTASGAYLVGKRVFNKLGLPWMCWKVFRRLVATVAAETTGDMRVASQVLGHGSVTVTEKYLGRGAEARARGVAAVGEYLRQVSGGDGELVAAPAAGTRSRKEELA